MSNMTNTEQWNWVLMAYGFAYIVLVLFVVSIGVRITRARRRLGELP
jgi:uncharacterized membrane protein